MSKAPIALFAYNRPEHLKKTISSLLANEGATESDLFIFADGPKIPDDSQVNQVRSYIKTISGFKKITLIESPVNKGLAQSITDGVTTLLNQYENIIVLEDDIITSPYFLNYMNHSLALYSNEPNVMHISGYMYPVNDTDLEELFFLKPSTCWGWATWRRAWSKFNRNIFEIEKKMNRKMRYDFNLDNSYDYYDHLTLNKMKIINTWAIFWYASCYLNNGLALHPKISMCSNIGHDGSGTNCGQEENFHTNLNFDNNFFMKKVPIKENLIARQKLIDYYKKIRPNRMKMYIVKLLRIARIK